MLGFPGGSDSKESTFNAGGQVQSLGWEDLLGKGMAFHGQRSLVGYNPWSHKELDTTE